jgi:hypothetical protein
VRYGNESANNKIRNRFDPDDYNEMADIMERE